MIFEYQVLNAVDRSKLRLERVRSLEADLCRIELALEDALSTAERDGLYRDAEIIRQRLEPHYAKMGLLTGSPVQEGAGDAAGVPDGELSRAG
jgi:hypothetical protein